MVEVDGKVLSREEQIAFMTGVMGFPREQAEFIYAIETGEIDGDIEYDPPLPEVDKDGEQPDN